MTLKKWHYEYYEVYDKKILHAGTVTTSDKGTKFTAIRKAFARHAIDHIYMIGTAIRVINKPEIITI
jgi:hypothetical protein